MALSNLPYDDAKIVTGLKALTVHREEVTDITVDFHSNDITDTATVTATTSWVISSADAVRLLDAAKPDTSSDNS